MVATPRVINAVVLPTHCQDSLSCQTSKKAAKLKANKGKNMRKPTDAESPIPRQILMMVSIGIFLKSPKGRLLNL